jgi:hypothetical protein
MSYREAVTKPSPGLPRFGGYPGYEGLTIATPTGLCQFLGSRSGGVKVQRRRSPVVFDFAQADATPLGLRALRQLDPRVAAKARQPWAELYNRFAVGGSELNQPFLKFSGHPKGCRVTLATALQIDLVHPRSWLSEAKECAEVCRRGTGNVLKVSIVNAG